MASSDFEVVVVGGGAAGVAATRRLRETSIRCLLIEARSRLGGRAWTITNASGFALDLGCGWLHSADRNPWVAVAEAQDATIDKTPPAWTRLPVELNFPRAEYSDFRRAVAEFYERLDDAARNDADAAASTVLDPGCRWNALIDAMSTYISGAELDRVSVKDLDRYDSTDINWRVVEGLGATIAAYGANLPVMLGRPVRGIDHRGKRLRIETAEGAIEADQVIVTVPSSLLAAELIAFTPSLPAKVKAARGLPLGVDDKLFMSLDHAEEFDQGVRLFAHTDRVATAGYHIRPFGRPLIEAYFGGRLAADLEANGEGAFFDFAVGELVGVLGSDFARRVKPIRVHRWGQDPFSLGSYSFALPGSADCRQTLAEPVDNRLFFAGEACSKHDFSTAHGGYHTGIAAAEQVIEARGSAPRELTQSTCR
jgi:monoamine oxidase